MAQKLVYLLARQRGEDAAFRPHFYGPYSDDVAAELAALVGSGLATEQIAVLDAWQPDQFDVLCLSGCFRRPQDVVAGLAPAGDLVDTG